MAIVDNALAEIKLMLSEKEELKTSDHFFSAGKRAGGDRVYITIHTNMRDFFVKYDRTAKSDTFKKEFQTLKHVKSNGFSVPQPIELIDKGIVMSVVNGVPLETIIKQDKIEKNIKLLNNAITRIASFHRRYASKTSKKELHDAKNNDKTTSLEQITTGTINLGYTHGDLDPFNTFFDSNSSKFGLIDWEDFSENGIQEFDALHFIVMTGTIFHPDIQHQKLYEIIFDKYKSNPYLRLLRTYCEERPSSFETVLGLVPAYCDIQNHRLENMQRNTSDFLYNEFKKIFNKSKVIS